MSNNILKKYLICTIFMIFFGISNISAAETLKDERPLNTTEVVKQSFVSPGDKNVELQLVINNDGDTTISTVKTVLFLESPFMPSINPNDKNNDFNYPGYLIGTGNSEYVPYFDLGGKQGRAVRFRIDVEKNAKYGNYDIPYAIYYGDNKIVNGKFTIRVSGSTLIEITDVLATPEYIVPGNDFEVTFKLKNSGENGIKWVRVDVSSDEKKIIPISSTTERIFADIESNASQLASYKFSTDRKIVPRNYPFTIALSYQDEKGLLYNETKTIGIKILGKAGPEIASFKTEPERILQGNPFTLTIRIENNEQGDARSVKAEIDIPVTGDKSAFLGKIAPDEDAPAVYMLKADKSGRIDYNLTIYYADDLGEHKKVQQMSIFVYPGDNNNTLLFGGLTIFFVMGFLFWRSRKGV